MASLEQAAVRGATLCASLIVAIGAQNAYVLRQGLGRAYVLPVVLICALSDALLISAGVAGVGAVLHALPSTLEALRWLGAAYLLCLAGSAFLRALRRDALGLVAGQGAERTLPRAVGTTLVLTYLNPHVYLDSVVLMGSVAARESVAARPGFAAGAIAVSFAWFFALGYGARLLRPLFVKPRAFRALDAAVAALMFWQALSLALVPLRTVVKT